MARAMQPEMGEWNGGRGISAGGREDEGKRREKNGLDGSDDHGEVLRVSSVEERGEGRAADDATAGFGGRLVVVCGGLWFFVGLSCLSQRCFWVLER